MRNSYTLCNPDAPPSWYGARIAAAKAKPPPGSDLTYHVRVEPCEYPAKKMR